MSTPGRPSGVDDGMKVAYNFQNLPSGNFPAEIKNGMLMITQEQKDKVSEIVGAALRERFKGEFVFDPIVAESVADEWDDDYLNVTVVFDGDQSRLDPGWTITLVRRVRPELYKAGVKEFPVIRYIAKPTWARWMRQDRLRAKRKKMRERQENRATR